MFRIGAISTRKYTVRVIPPPMDLSENKFYLAEETKKLVAPFCKDFYDYDRRFFLCGVNDVKRNVYVDLVKNDDFPFVSYRFPPKQAGKEQTPEEAIYETEYRYWAHNKEHQQSMLYLHRSTLEKVIDRCVELSQ